MRFELTLHGDLAGILALSLELISCLNGKTFFLQEVE